MSNQWHGGKGDAPRKGADRKAYEDGWDRIFGNKKPEDEKVEDELQGEGMSDLRNETP